MKRRFVVISETLERIDYTGPQHALIAGCESCGSETGWLPIAGAALGSGVSERGIHRLIDAGAVHYRETPDGLLLICENSLACYGAGDE